jgi:hypothetical protein
VTTREQRERQALLHGAPLRMSWGAVFGGVVAALGVAILLYALGLALGLDVVVDPAKPSSLRTSGVFTSVWMLVMSLAALFVGGLVAGRGAYALTHAAGAIHGLVMWALTTLAAVWLIFNVFGAVLSGAASVGKSAVQAGASAITGGAGPARDLAKNLGIDAQSALEPVNQNLRARGQPEITPQQLDDATKGVVQDALRTGRMDRQGLVRSISEHTALSSADAEQLANRVEQQFAEGRSKLTGSLADAGRTLQTGTLNAANTTGKVFWAIFVALSLGLVAAVLGANVGIGRRQRVWIERPPSEGGTPPGFYPGSYPDRGYATGGTLHPRTHG